MFRSPQWGGPLGSGYQQPAWTPRRVQRRPRHPAPRVCLIVVLSDRGWIPAGVASQKTGPVASDIARLAPPYTFGARKDPRIQRVSALDASWTPGWTPGASGVSTNKNGESRLPTHSPHYALRIARNCCMCRTQKCCNTLDSFRHSGATRSWSVQACACAMPSCGQRQVHR